MGAKIKTPKNSMPIFQAIKISRGTCTARTHGNYQESSDCFEYPKKFLLKSSSPKKYLPKFSYPNKILKSKISNPKKSFDHPCHLKSRETWNPRSPHCVMDPGTYKHFILTFVKQIPQSPRWTLFLGQRIDSINKVAVTLTNFLINNFFNC